MENTIAKPFRGYILTGGLGPITESKFNMMCWNATGIMSSSTYLCDVLNKHAIDICGIAEHWLFDNNLLFLESIDNMYCSHAVSDYSLALPSNRRVGKGGVALLWKRSINHMITPLEIEDDRIIGIRVQINPENILYVFEVYVPCSNHGIDSFKKYIEKIENLFYKYNHKGMVLVMGDFNAELKTHSRRGAHFVDTTRRNNITSINDTFLQNTYTNYSYSSGSGSTIDHILISKEKLDLISSTLIPDDDALNVSSHRPIMCTLSLQIQNKVITHETKGQMCINWSKVKQEHIIDYQILMQLYYENSGLYEQNTMSIEQIDYVYNELASIISEANKSCFPKSKFKHYVKPYWDEELKSMSNLSNSKRHTWINDGKPRGNEFNSYREYKNAKRMFRKAHRRKVQTYISNQFEEIDKYATVDSTLFWKSINRRKKKSKTAVGNEMIFNNNTFRDPKQINDNWAEYFKTLYSPSVDEQFDTTHKAKINNELDQILNNVSTHRINTDETSVSLEEVRNVCKKAKRNKACGPDGIFYENFKFGGDALVTMCAKLFSSMLAYSYCPNEMKKGEIIILHKGGNKSHDDPNNYRAITLSSVLLKLYEAVILNRMKNKSMPLNDLQGGFRKGMGCIMTSFMFRECNNFVMENNSKLYMCFLDVRQAFDRVWHEALMVKLYKTNTDVYLFKAVYNLYQNMVSRVRSNGHISNWFPILQGTRQGGIISPHLYLVFINDLMNELCNSGYGLTVYGLNCCCPSSADDMVLLSLSRVGLQELMQICYQYGCAYRYTYNANKSAVIVSNDTHSYRQDGQTWTLGNNCVQETDTYMHLGVLFHKNMDLSNIVHEASNKLRKTLFSILNCGIFEGGIHPLTAKHLYETIVLPKALYGCEVWSNLLQSDIEKLETTHRFCLKIIQSLPRLARTDIVLSSLGSLPIEAEIDKRKLMLFGQLCRLDTDTTIKMLFLNRLFNFNNHPSRVRGFIPDIYKILHKYDLIDILSSYCKTGVFPSKCRWKTVVNNNIKTKQMNLLQERVMTDGSLCDYCIIQSLSEVKPCDFWKISQFNRTLLKTAQASIKLTVLLFSKPYVCTCRKCNSYTDNIVMHLSFECEKTVHIRDMLWTSLLHFLGNNAYAKFITMQPRLQLIHILSGLQNFHLVDSEVKDECLKSTMAFCFRLLKTQNLRVT